MHVTSWLDAGEGRKEIWLVKATRGSGKGFELASFHPCFLLLKKEETVFSARNEPIEKLFVV